MKIQNLVRRAGCRFFTATGLVLMTAATVHADYQSTILGDNPLAFYALNPGADGTSTAPDLTGNGNAGQAVNITAATGPSPYITNAASFDGTAAIDLSQGSNPGLLNFTGPITLEAWAQPNSSTLFADILAKGYDAASPNPEIVIRVNGPYGANYYGNSGTTGVTGGTQTTNWTYIVLSSDGTNNTLYENGVKVAQAADTGGSVTFNDDWMIGNGSGAGNGRLFNGNISEVAIYGHGLTAAQVLNHYYYGLLNTAANVSAPIIVTQPQSQTTYLGGSVTFSVTAVSALPMTNQWYKAGAPLAGQTNSTLTLFGVASGDAVNYTVVVGNSNGTTNSAPAALTLLTPGNNLKWSATGNSGVWDTGSSANWINLGNSSPTAFNTGDQVLFDDTTGVPTSVSVNSSVAPSIITVNSSVNNFQLTGSGPVTGPGSLVKEGSSVLTLNTTFNLTGPVTIGGGSVVGENNAFNSVASVTATNGGTMDFGGSSLTDNKPVTVSGTGLNGQGAIFNSGGAQYGQILDIILAGDASYGGSNRWDLGSGSSITGPHTLTINWVAGGGYDEWNSVTVGTNVVGIVLTNGNFGSKFMDSGFQNPATVFTVSPNIEFSFWNGGWNGSFHILSGATVDLWTAPAPLNGSTVTLEQNAQWRSWGSSSTAEPVNSALILNGVAHFILGDHNLVYTNLVSGPGGFILDYWNNAVVFSSSNTYSGPTVIGSDGNSPEVSLTGNGSISHSSLIFFGGSNPSVTHLDASGRSDQTLTLASGQTLAGVGGINGSLIVSPGATVSPSGTNITLTINTTSTNAVGTIAAANNVTLGGTTVLKLDGSGSNDMVQAAGNITYGGTLNLVNISGSPLVAGNTFTLFSAASYSGSFGSITPATPGTGLAWDTTQLNSGIIGVVTGSASPIISSTKVSGGSLIFSGTGGTANATYYVLTTTNLTGTWSPIATNTYDGSGNFSVTNLILAGVPHQFYRTSSQP